MALRLIEIIVPADQAGAVREVVEESQIGSQTGPVHSGGQVQVSGAVQAPPFWHGSMQTGIEQSMPVHSGRQLHVFGSAHTPPFWQGRSQIAEEQSVPSQPGSHLHTPSMQMPWPEHELGHPPALGLGAGIGTSTDSGPCVAR